MTSIRQSTRSSKSLRGFTIIELLVAAAVTIVLVTLMISIITSVLATWNTSTGRLTAQNQAKLALSFLARDLQAIVMKNDGNVWLAASIQNDQTSNSMSGDTIQGGVARTNSWNPSFNVPNGVSAFGKPFANGSSGNPAGPANPAAESLNLNPATRNISDYRFGHAGVWLRFFTQQPDANGDINEISAPRAVSYQIARVPVRDGTTSHTNPENYPDLRWAMFRTQVRPTPFTGGAISSVNRSTIGVGFNIVANEYQIATAAAGGGNAGDPGAMRRPNKFADLLAENVIDFGVRIYERINAAGDVVLVFPTNNTYANATRAWCYLATNPNAPVAGLPTPAVPFNVSTLPGVPAGIVRGKPASIELFIRVLTAEGVRKLQALELGRVSVPPEYAGKEGEYWWELAIQNSVTFTRRVDLPVEAR